MPEINDRSIGVIAGEIWKLLSDGKRLAVSSIVSTLNEPASIVCMGIGWLAREDKIRFEKAQKRGVLISLK
jgi:hypothetical protein